MTQAKLIARQLHKFTGVKMKKLITFIFVFVFLLNLAIAQEDIRIVKEGPSKVKFGDVVTIKINVINEMDQEIEIILREIIVNAEAIEPKLISPEISKDIIAARPPYLEWNLIVQSKSNKSVEYKIKPNTIGEYNTGATVGIFNGNEILSNDLTIIVSCNGNNKCEPELSENYQNCQIDCPSGSKDNLCDLIKDGRCDPDCTREADIDCKCGDGVCEKFENNDTCSIDCKISFWQWLINFIKSLFKLR